MILFATHALGNPVLSGGAAGRKAASSAFLF